MRYMAENALNKFVFIILLGGAIIIHTFEWDRLKGTLVVRNLLYLVLMISALALWFQLNEPLTNANKYVLIGAIIFGILVILFPGVFKGIFDLLGLVNVNDRESKWWRIAEAACEMLSVAVIAIIFVYYMLIEFSQLPTPGFPQLGAGISGLSLGGLMITMANNRRINDHNHQRIMRVAQKLISSALLLGLFTLFYFAHKSVGVADPNTFEFSTQGCLRGIYFWGSELCLVLAGMLLSMGIIELLFVIRTVALSKTDK
jgi:uncharacterized membrane protein YozB (DUF420 family)